MKASEAGLNVGAYNLNTPVADWANALCTGDRRALSRLLTFSESSRADQQALVDGVLAVTNDTGCYRVAVSGAPGAGKSSLLEALGTYLVVQGKRVGVLAIDPTSRISGGSILADKTRMTQLSAAKGAFVRPSPSGLGHGGICSYTSRSLALCDRAGFDCVFLETVGVGQTELEAVSLVDCFVMVVSPSGGDELQGMKRGITEHADIVVVNKLDQDPALARRTCNSYDGALQLLRGKAVPTLTVSAQQKLHIDDLWDEISKFCSSLSADSRAARREREREREFWAELLRRFEREMRARSELAGDPIAHQLAEVVGGNASAQNAADRVWSLLLAADGLKNRATE